MTTHAAGAAPAVSQDSPPHATGCLLRAFLSAAVRLLPARPQLAPVRRPLEGAGAASSSSASAAFPLPLPLPFPLRAVPCRLVVSGHVLCPCPDWWCVYLSVFLLLLVPRPLHPPRAPQSCGPGCPLGLAPPFGLGSSASAPRLFSTSAASSRFEYRVRRCLNRLIVSRLTLHPCSFRSNDFAALHILLLPSHRLRCFLLAFFPRTNARAVLYCNARFSTPFPSPCRCDLRCAHSARYFTARVSQSSCSRFLAPPPALPRTGRFTCGVGTTAFGARR